MACPAYGRLRSLGRQRLRRPKETCRRDIRNRAAAARHGGAVMTTGDVARSVTSADRAETISGLSDVLDGVRTAMGADTATVLVLDGTRSFLEPLATVGLGRTLQVARRVPFGQGFAGRIAQSRQPVALSQVDSSTVVN